MRQAVSSEIVCVFTETKMLTVSLIFLTFFCCIFSSVLGEMMCGKLPNGIVMQSNFRGQLSGRRVVGGMSAMPGSHPWILSLKKKGGTVHHCGGALIRVSEKEQTDIVITAAHCVFDKKTNKTRPMTEETVTAGTTILYPRGDDQLNGVQIVWVSNGYYHGWYPKSRQINDIAILLLKTPINFTENVQPVCLSESGDQVEDGNEVTVAGWGLTDEKATKASLVLMQAGLPVVNPGECAKKLSGNAIKNCTMLCAGYEEGGMDACRGDSGGPLVEKKNGIYVLQGVVSFGIGCAQRGKPGVYTRVSSYINWITKKVKKYSQVYRSDKTKGDRGLQLGRYDGGNGKLKYCDRNDSGEFQDDIEDRYQKKRV